VTRRRAPAAAALVVPALVVPALVAFASVPALVHRDGPPPAHTGGLGEPSCAACHFDGELNDPAGAVDVAGVPQRYTPGARYRVRIRLTHPELERAGFEVAARFADGERAGRQAGGLRLLDEARTAVTAAGGVDYLHHTRTGSEPTAARHATWEFEWTAPAARAGAVVFHLAANAANGDDSELGDHIYTHAVRSR